MNTGLDILGMAHPNFKVIPLLTTLSRDTPLGFFWDTFGNAKPKFRRMLNNGFHTFRIHCHWDDQHKIIPMAKLTKVLKEIKVITDKHPHITLYISPSCEHNEANKAEVRKRLQEVQKIIPYAIPVNSVWTGAALPKFITEKHGSNVTTQITSTDGINVYDINVTKFLSDSRTLQFIWGARFNGRQITKPNQKVPSIPERTAFPDKKYFLSVARLLTPKGNAPTPSFKAKKFKAPNLWKSHSEDSAGTVDTRNNKPVIIIAENVPNLIIVDKNGKEVCKIPKYGIYEGNQYRYYSGRGPNLYGYEMAEKALKQSGSEFIWIRAGNTFYGPIHPAFRQGTFRD